jgi:hypothetical protein
MPTGRPTKKTPELIDKICDRIATSSKGLHAICKEEGMPDPSQVYRWMNEDEEFRNKYTRARETQADLLVGEIIEIADETSNDTIHVQGKGDGAGYDIPNKEWIDRSKLRVDARKWAASKLAPKKYGDRIELDAPNGLIQVNIRE